MSVAETCLPEGEAVKGHLQHHPSQDSADGESIMLLEPRSFRPFKTSEEYLYAMKEDLAEWLNNLYSMDINVDSFFERLDTGEVLCAHANNVRRLAEEKRLQQQDQHHQQQQQQVRRFSSKWEIPQYDVVYRQDVTPGSFFARDNVHNFISWCRDLGIYEVLLFETDDLVLRKNEKHVILSLLEVARRGARFGMAAPLLVQMEADIDRELEQERLAEERLAENGGQFNGEDEAWNHDGHDLTPPEPPKMFYGPQPQIITNDLKSLDEMVRDLVERCSCPSQFPMVKVSEGKYRIGDTRVLIFVRILRNHVMVRVGGGWDTLEHYLDKHDPCRCRQGHRIAVGSRVGFKTSTSGQERQLMNVTYERKRSTGGQIISVQSTRERVAIQQIAERSKMGIPPPPPFPVQESIQTLTSVPEVEFLEAEKGNPVTMLVNLITQNEKDSFTEESIKDNKFEHFAANLQSSLLSEVKLTPPILTSSVQIFDNSVEIFLKKEPVASSLQNEVVTMKSYHLLSPKSVQKMKISSEMIRSSSLPVISEIKCQVTRGRTATKCRSKENLPGNISKDKVKQRSNNNTIHNASKNHLDSPHKCKRIQSLKSDEVSAKHLSYKIEETGLNWTEGNAFCKLESENIKDTLSIKTGKKSPLHTLETDLVMAPTKENINFQFKKELETETSQKLPLSRIPKCLKRAHVVTHQDYEKSRTAPVSSGTKSLKIPQKNETSCTSRKGKLINPSKKGSPEHAAKKGIMENSPKKEISFKMSKTDSQKIHPHMGNVHNDPSVEKLQETKSQGTFQKSQRVGKLYYSIKSGHPQNSSDNKNSQCFPQKRSAHSSLIKGLSQHSTSDRKHTTHNVADTKIPIHIHSLKETLHKSTNKWVTQSIPEKAFGILPKKGPSPHRRIPVSKEVIGRPSYMVPVTEISCQLNNINFTNRETLKETDISVPTLDMDIQQESIHNTFYMQQLEDKYVCNDHVQSLDIQLESTNNTFSKYPEDKYVYNDHVQNITEELSYKHSVHKSKNGYIDPESIDKDEMHLPVAMNKNVTKQYATDKDVNKEVAVTKVLGSIQQETVK